PFVQSYWNWAAAKTGNEAALTQGLGAIYRAAALFLTNYENMVAETGDFLGTEINSDRMLWSMAGNLAMVHRVFMGMQFKPEGLYFNPVVPKAYGGVKTLSNFQYRDAVLDITVKGHGRSIRSATIDGKTTATPFIPAHWRGSHSIVITLADDALPHQSIHSVANHFSPPTVLAEKKGNMLVWPAAEGAVAYRVYQNGQLVATTRDRQFAPTGADAFASYQVSGVDAQGHEGFASEPVVFARQVQIIEIEDAAPASTLPYTNYSGKGFVEISLEKNRSLSLSVQVETAGEYLLDLRYANGSGPWNTDNKCAIRSLTVNDRYAGVLVFPQRGKDEWSDWGYSNPRKVRLRAGANTVLIHFEDWNHNMNVDTNTAMLDALRVTRVE
ncbi:MAG TPA: hypothetical protein PK858_10140, partial [Saprospiraceae bacterium]|nr:hypothetical protein [Saprospiraceae bacterium]